jgi:hypothetical protein
MENTSSTHPDIFFCYFYEGGRYIQRSFYTHSKEDAQEKCNLLNEKWGITHPDECGEDQEPSLEYWTWEQVEHKSECPYLK